MKVIGHLSAFAAVFLILAVPFLRSGKFAQMINKDYDTVTGASVIIENPSGNYVVIINSDMHPNAENLAVWEDFFSGEEISYLFEDISCVCAAGDEIGTQEAEAFMSRLPENQMKIRTEDGTLMISKAEYGRFDIIIMSEEFAAAYGADTLYDNEKNVIIKIEEFGSIGSSTE